MTAADLAKQIQSQYSENRRKERETNWKPAATPASAIGYHCERRLYYIRTQPELAAPPNAELASIFAEGDIHHREIRTELARLGYEVVDVETQFADERLELRGTIDGRLRTAEGRRIPIEIKSMASDGPQTAEDWRLAEGLLGRYYAQLQAYLFLTAQPAGIIVVKNKLTGLLTCTAIPLDYDRAEELLKRAERVRDAVKLKVIPDRILDRSECRGCPFETTCLPGDAPTDPLLIAEDDTLINDMRAREEMAPTAKAHAKLDKKLKDRFKLTKGDRFIAGEFIVTKRTNSAGAVYVETEVAPGCEIQPPAQQNLEDALRRSIAQEEP